MGNATQLLLILWSRRQAPARQPRHCSCNPRRIDHERGELARDWSCRLARHPLLPGEHGTVGAIDITGPSDMKPPGLALAASITARVLSKQRPEMPNRPPTRSRVLRLVTGGNFPPAFCDLRGVVELSPPPRRTARSGGALHPSHSGSGSLWN